MTSTLKLTAVPSAEESAQALTNYMAKAHEEKLKALKALELKKDAEIKALKEQIASASSSSSAITLSNTKSSQSVEELTAKLTSYQKFISNYIVKAQEDKAKAVKAAEAAITKKYEEKLNVLMLNAASKSSSATGQISKSSGNVLFDGRNANVIAASKAGKSRWGDKEVQRIGGDVAAASVPTSKETLSVQNIELSLYDKRNMLISKAAAAGKQSRWGKQEETKAIDGSSGLLLSSTSSETVIRAVNNVVIDAADHGLRNDGGVGGPSLSERVQMGTNVLDRVVTTSGLDAPTLYDKRNMFISNAAKAGKQARWGTKEENRAIEKSLILPSSSSEESNVRIVTTPEIEAANHGLRNDGGVGGPSLAERVNLGARILQ